MSKTQDNLKTAFAGESQANRKYLAFAKAALAEGKENLAKLFRAVAEGETVHAFNHLNVLAEVKTAEENIQSAIAGETYETEKMYPGFIADAQGDSEKAAEISFTSANKVEQVHKERFEKALAQVKEGKDIEPQEYYVCSVCGNLLTSPLPDNCPICNTPKEKFVVVA